MRILKRHPILKPGTNYVIDSPTPSNISYWWNIGSLLGLSLGIQIITGVTLAMHYNASVLEAFNSVEHIMRDVNNGWLIRYLHSNTASAFFFLVYLHIGRGLYYGSYKAPRTLVWTIGTVIFILMMATAFLGYVLPYGQMSLWGATVITNLMSAIPWIGQDIVEFVWGGFSVNNATLNRFFSLHFVLPFVLAGLAMLHLMSLHDSAGSNNPLGMSSNCDRIAFAPYFIFKDLITIFIFMWVLSLFVFFLPNVLGDSENYVMANPMQTPPAIVPEWYLLPFYAILRSIPNKLVGVIAMFSAILIILAMTFGDLAKLRGIQFKPISKIFYFFFVANLLLLMVLGAKHVESPFIESGQLATATYFLYFILIVSTSSLFENSFSELYENIKGKLSTASNNISLSKISTPHSFVKTNLLSMTNVQRSMFQAHPFHLVSPSPWPLNSSIALLSLTCSGVLTMHGFANASSFVFLAFFCLLASMTLWFRDVISEGTYLGNHTLAVQRGLNMGVALFIISEALFFLAIFWAYFHSSLSPTSELGAHWPPAGIEAINPFELPLINTVILLSSGFTVTYAHHCLIQGNRSGALNGLALTAVLAIIFTAFQVVEYSGSFFSISDGTFGSCFYFGTGFHGLHVIIGTAFLAVGLWRMLAYHSTENHHLGLESGILYWHFVDVVWIFLFISVYYWGC